MVGGGTFPKAGDDGKNKQRQRLMRGSLRYTSRWGCDASVEMTDMGRMGGGRDISDIKRLMCSGEQTYAAYWT